MTVAPQTYISQTLVLINLHNQSPTATDRYPEVDIGAFAGKADRVLLDEAVRRRIESPCIGVCVIDPATDCCEGCFRTLAEVAAWSTSSTMERRQILDRVDHRRAEQTGSEA